jgi:hypothetical protein
LLGFSFQFTTKLKAIPRLTMISHEHMDDKRIEFAKPITGSRQQTIVFNIEWKSLPQSLAGSWPIRVSRRGFAS